jgi:hypothetical protein
MISTRVAHVTQEFRLSQFLAGPLDEITLEEGDAIPLTFLSRGPVKIALAWQKYTPRENIVTYHHLRLPDQIRFHTNQKKDTPRLQTGRGNRK